MPHMNFAFWGLVTAGIAYCVPDWHKMQLIFSVPMLALLVSYWIMPESPRCAYLRLPRGMVKQMDLRLCDPTSLLPLTTVASSNNLGPTFFTIPVHFNALPFFYFMIALVATG